MAENNTVETTGTTEESGKTFTQAEVNAIIEGRLVREREKYSDYESLKEKAGKFDEIQEANKTEIQKANEKAEALAKELESLKASNTIKAAREKVAKETEVPAELLTGNDEETCKAQAEAILKFATSKPSHKTYPGTQSTASNTSNQSQTPTELAMRQLAHQLFNKGE